MQFGKVVPFWTNTWTENFTKYLSVEAITK